MKKLLTLFMLTLVFGSSSKNDFNKLFIKVSQEGSPTVVSIVSEKTEKYINPFFFVPSCKFSGFS